MKWMQLPDEYSDENADIVLVPIEYEGEVEYGKGAKNGSKEIIAASAHLEYYDDELDAEPFEKGIRLEEPFTCDLDPVEAHKAITAHVEKFTGKFMIGLGGDHSISSAFVEALAKKHKDVSVLFLDAHADLRQSWNGSEWNHACVARRVVKNHNVAILGVRALDREEMTFAKENKKVKLVRAYDITEESIQSMIDHLSENVFISIDVDVFDPSIIRNTGTPEPGGLDWYEVLTILRKVFEEKTVIGCDMVEFAPKENFRAEAFTLAKLVYKLIGYQR